MPQLHGMYLLNKSLRNWKNARKFKHFPDSLDSPQYDRPVGKDQWKCWYFYSHREKHISCVKAGGIFWPKTKFTSPPWSHRFFQGKKILTHFPATIEMANFTGLLCRFHGAAHWRSKPWPRKLGLGGCQPWMGVGHHLGGLSKTTTHHPLPGVWIFSV